MTDQSVWSHDGSDEGIATVFVLDRAAGVGALAFTNSQNDDETFPDLLRDITQRLLDEFR